MTSWVVILRALFSPPTLNLKKNPVNQLIKKFWPKLINIILKEGLGTFMFLFCRVFVYMCFVVTCWERADLLALVCGV